MGALSACAAQRFLWQLEDKVATVALNRPKRKNPFTFESYDRTQHERGRSARLGLLQPPVRTGGRTGASAGPGEGARRRADLRRQAETRLGGRLIAREALDWPFPDEDHRALAAGADAWCRSHLGHIDHGDTDAACRSLDKQFGAAGWLRRCVPGEKSVFSARRICLMRETLAWHDGLADFAFAMQGLGSGVRRGEIRERLYREIRALRICEGASEVQKLIIAREELKRAGQEKAK